MKLRREAKTLKRKAVCSLRHGLAAFNSYDEDGRITTVLLHLQHACEMLLKAALVQTRVGIFDKTGRSYRFEKCLNLAKMHCGLTHGEAGVMRAVDSLRDAEQHWIIFTEEDVLYLHARGLVTAVDEVLKRVFDDDLTSHLPVRVLPISTEPPGDIDFLVDREFRKIAELLAPGRRARDEARGRIRTLLAMESHVVDEVAVSERDITRIENAIRTGKGPSDVFPRLSTLAMETSGSGIQVKVHFTKKQGAPVRFVSGDDPEEAGAVRELDLRKKFHMRATELAKRLGLTPPKSAALRDHLGIDQDRQCTHTFEFGRTKISCYSDNAARRMKDALEEVDMEADLGARRDEHALKSASGTMSEFVTSPDGRSKIAADACAFLLRSLESSDLSAAAAELLLQGTVLTWSALEMLSRDLFESVLNTNPTKLKNIMCEPTARQRLQSKFTLDELATHSFDLSSSLGTLLSSQQDFSDLRTIKATILPALNADAALAAALGDKTLWVLCQQRHLIVHRRGVIDSRYLEATGEQLPIGSRLSVSPSQLESQLEAVVSTGTALLAAAGRHTA